MKARSLWLTLFSYTHFFFCQPPAGFATRILKPSLDSLTADPKPFKDPKKHRPPPPDPCLAQC